MLESRRRCSRRAAPPPPGVLQEREPRNRSPDSGISSSSLHSVDHDSSDLASKQFNSTRVNEDSPHMKDLSLASQTSSLLSMSSSRLSLSSDVASFEAEKVAVSKPKPAPKPPVRRDSINSGFKKVTKMTLEKRYMSRFQPIETFPAPLPFENCTKNYPSKELFTSSKSPRRDQKFKAPNEESKSTVEEPSKQKSRLTIEGSNLFISKILSIKSSLTSPSFAKQQNLTSKPTIPEKPNMDRSSLLKLRTQSRVMRSQSVSSPLRPSVSIRSKAADKENIPSRRRSEVAEDRSLPRRRSEAGEDMTNVVRKAPPPPTRVSSNQQ